MAYMVTANRLAEAVVRGPMAFQKAMREAFNLAGQGFDDAVVSQLNSSFQIDVTEWLRTISKA